MLLNRKSWSWDRHPIGSLQIDVTGYPIESLEIDVRTGTACTKVSLPNLRVQRVNRYPFYAPMFFFTAGNPAGDLETSSMMIAHAAVEYVGKSSLTF